MRNPVQREATGTDTPPMSLPLPLPRAPRYHSLDFWRGVACLMVVVFHASFYQIDARSSLDGVYRVVFDGINLLWLGVPLFFVISGYCISATCDSLRRKPRSVKEYCVRRWRRIFPPFWFALAATVVLTALLPQIFCDSVRPMGQPLDLNPWQWLGNVTLTELWRPYLGGGDTLWILGPAWSLCYEEQFYILCGIALFLAPQRFFLLMAVITVVVLIGVAVAPTLGLSLKGFFLDGRWLMFAAGVLVYWARNYGRPRRSITLLSVCAVALVLGWPGIRILNPYIGLRAIAVAIVFALLLLLIERHDKRLQQKTAGGLVTCCGTMCYSLYLIHWPVVKLVSQGLWRMGVTTPLNTLTITIPACMIASIAVALFFHRKIERRFMHISA